MQDLLKFRSSVSSSLVSKSAIAGFFKAFPGICLLTYAGVFLPPPQLAFWGPLVFITATCFFVWGLVPYKRLTRLEKKPNEIVIDNVSLWFYLQGKRPEKIDWEDIETIQFLQSGTFFGISLHLKNGSKKILPYFSKRVLTDLEEIKASHQEMTLNG